MLPAGEAVLRWAELPTDRYDHGGTASVAARQRTAQEPVLQDVPASREEVGYGCVVAVLRFMFPELKYTWASVLSLQLPLAFGMHYSQGKFSSENYNCLKVLPLFVKT